MTEFEILMSLKEKYPSLINNTYPFPDVFWGSKKIKAIVLGADPTNIINGKPKSLKKVFQLDNPKSPYWRAIKSNIEQINNLDLENLYVQNMCRNYFCKETSKNKEWLNIAKNYWLPFLKDELDAKFEKNIPVLMTTEFILKATLKPNIKCLKAKDIYSSLITINQKDNLLGRKLIAFYRHYKYNLAKWHDYKCFINI